MSNWSSQPDEEIRRAAAGVMGWQDGNPFWWLIDEQAQEAKANWMPHADLNQLARVFAAALEIRKAKSARAAVEIDHQWLTALTDPRASLCQLLDLLQVPLPAAARE